MHLRGIRKYYGPPDSHHVSNKSTRSVFKIPRAPFPLTYLHTAREAHRRPGTASILQPLRSLT